MIRSNLPIIFSFFLSIFSTTVKSQVYSVCNCIECPVPIIDNYFSVASAQVNLPGQTDLATCPLERVCFTIEHTWIGDLSVSLKSPGGKDYLIMADNNNEFGGCGSEGDNADVCIELGDWRPLTNKIEYVCNDAPCPLGICCLVGNWTMPCGGVNDPIYNAQQAPNCDLNDFNVPGDPVNGEWQLVVSDVCTNDIGFIWDFRLEFDCSNNPPNTCLANGGIFLNDEINSCYGEVELDIPANPSFCGNPPPDTNLFQYAYFIVQNDSILAIVDNPDLTSYPPGSYQVFGISYENAAESNVQGFLNETISFVLLTYQQSGYCWAFSGNYIEVNILGDAVPFNCSDIIVNAGDDQTIDCIDGNLLLATVTVPSFYDCQVFTWTNADGDVLNPVSDRQVFVTEPGVYIFTYQTPNLNCMVSDTLEVYPSSILSVDAGPDTILACWTNSYLIQPTISATINNYTAEWKDETSGEYQSAFVPYFATHSGTYTLTVTDTSSNCQLTDFVQISIPLTIIDSVQTTTADCNEANGSATVFTNPNATINNIEWSSGETTQSISGLAQGWYSVTVSDATCQYSQNIYVDEDRSCKVVVSGFVYVDHVNQDCMIDTTTIGIEGIMLHLLPDDIYTYSMPDGSYEFVVDAGDHTVEYVEEDVYELLCPASGVYNISLPVDGTVSQGNDFFVKKELGQNLSINMSFGNARPGNKIFYAFEYCNLGTEPSDALITVTLDPLLEDFTLSNTADTYDPTTNMATWSVPELLPGECEYVYFQMHLPSSVPFGTLLNGSIKIEPIDIDPYPNNNTEDWVQEVTASFDPNNKTSLTGENQWGGDISPNDHLINYQINFQNTGNDTAFTVVIRDTLDNNLDVETIRAGISSHDYFLQFEGNNILIFNFQNIHLPDSTTDVEASKGFVTFTIHLKDNLLPRTEIHNSAAIYFDYNAPVITNKTIHRIPVPIFYENINVDLCAGNTYNGIQYFEPTSFIDTLSLPLLDSIIHTQINISENPEIHLNEFICAGEYYLVGGEIFEETGEYAVVLNNAAGCDSTVFISLEVGADLISETTASICNGFSYEFFGDTLSAAGIYSEKITAINGCDSLVVLHLEVFEDSYFGYEESICASGNYLFNGEHLTETGTYTAILENSYGCDSTVVLGLTVTPNIETNIVQHICEGESFEFDGEPLIYEGVYAATFSSSQGCDSLVNLELIVLPISEFHIMEEICEGEEYIFNNDTLSATGSYVTFFQNDYGCDSAVFLELRVSLVHLVNLTEEICEGDSLIYNGEILTDAGTYTTEFTNIYGCDSIVELALSVIPNIEIEQDTAVEMGGSIYGIPIFSDTTIVQDVLHENGCFYTLTTHVQVVVGTNNLFEIINLHILPNPNNGNFILKGELPNSGKYDIEIFNVFGQRTIEPTNGIYFNKNMEWHMNNNLPPGMYYLKLTGKDMESVVRFVVTQ